MMIGDGHRHPEEHPKGTSHPFKLPPPPSQLTLNFLLLTCHQEPWFLEINPNGRIPALTDVLPDGSPIRLFESGSIMQYLVDRYDTEHKVSYPRGSREYYEVNNWVCSCLFSFSVCGGKGVREERGWCEGEG